MAGGDERGGRWCRVLFLALLLIAPGAWAEAGKGEADVLCGKAGRAERDAKEFERKSEQRRRFLNGEGGTRLQDGTFPGGDTTANRQAIKAQVAQVRAILPQFRQGAESARRDRGIVPGLEQYFVQMEGNMSRLLQAVDVCLDSPERCSVPPISCPPPPGMPSFNNSGSASFIRQVQQTYAQAASQLQQACQGMNGRMLADVERLRRGSHGAGMQRQPSGSADATRFGDADLYLPRAESLRRDASRYRLEADRVSGVRGYCQGRGVSRDPAATRAAFDALKAAAGKRERKPEADFPLDGTVIDLKAAWEAKWGKGPALKASDVPLPKLSAGGDAAETVPGPEKKMDAAWMEHQKKLVQERLEEPNKWSSAIIDSLKTNAPPLPYKKFDELQSGDVLLIAPEGVGWAINKTDKVLSGDKESNASHTIIYLKEIDGKKFFMDSQPFEGVRIVPEAYVVNKYGSREMEVATLAQPLKKDQADALYMAAKEMRAKNLEKIQTGHWYDKTGYGLGMWDKEDKVCSEADWALINAAGRNVPMSDDRTKGIMGIQFSPADFYGNEQYFLVTPFVMKK